MAENYPTNLKTDQQKNTYKFLKLENPLCDEEQQYYLFHEWYYGALCVLTNKDNPDRFSQAANSLRESMEKLVMHYLKEIKDPEKELKSEARSPDGVKKFHKAIDPIWHRIPNNIHDNTYDEFMNLRKKLEDITHHKLREPLDDSKFSKFIERFEGIILRLNNDIRKEQEEISMLVKNHSVENNPADNRKLLLLAILRGSNFMWFFKEIDDDETWFPLLNENGFFSGASDDRRYSPSVLYLKKIARKIPNEVVGTILKMKKTKHSNILCMVFEIALATPLKESVRLKDWILSYFKKRPYLDLTYIKPDIISDLIKYWSEREINGTNAGIELIKKVVSFEPDPRYKEKQQARKKNLLITDPENPALEDVEFFFEESRRLEDIEPQPKLGHWWKYSEGYWQYCGGYWQYCEILRKGVCPVCESKPFEVSKVLIEVTSVMLSMRSDPEERKEGNDDSERWCPSLEGATQKCKYLTAKESMCKLVQTLTLACEQVYKKAPEKIKELDKILTKGKWLVFKRIHRHLLNPNEQPKPESHKDVITESPKSVEDLSSFTDKELLNYINNYKERKFIEEGTKIREIGIEGLDEEFGCLFEESIINTPSRIDFWLKNLKEIKNPIYIDSILQKISEEVREGNLEQLDIWFQFCGKILPKLSEIYYYGCLIDFVEACLSANKLPVEKYESLRDILCTESGLRINEDVILTLDKEGSISDKYDEHRHSRYRSRTLASLVKIGRWIRIHDAEANVDTIITILEDHLSDNTQYPIGPSERATLAEHYINIYILNPEWALKHKDKFFPKNDLKLFEKTLSHFLAFNQAHRKTFEIISSELCFAIEHLSEFKNTDDPFISFTIGRDSMDLIDLIGKHLSCYYVIGAFPLKDNKSLLQKYYHQIKEYNKERWGDLFYFMGDLAIGCSKDYEQKFKDYFNWRFQETEEKLRQKELERFFLNWFKAECLDTKWRLDSYSKILETVIPTDPTIQTMKLKEMLPMHLEKVVECFAKLVKAIKNRPEPEYRLHDRESIEAILRAGLNSKDKTVRDNAAQAANNLLILGDYPWVLDLMKEQENH